MNRSAEQNKLLDKTTTSRELNTVTLQAAAPYYISHTNINSPNARPHPHTMMIKTRNAHVAVGTVRRPRRLVVITGFAEFPRARHRIRQGQPSLDNHSGVPVRRIQQMVQRRQTKQYTNGSRDGPSALPGALVTKVVRGKDDNPGHTGRTKPVRTHHAPPGGPRVEARRDDAQMAQHNRFFSFATTTAWNTAPRFGWRRC